MISTTYVYKHDTSAGDIPAYVYHDEGYGGEDRPIAIAFHAGRFVMGSASMIPQSQIHYLVKAGFVVVVPEYRLCPQVKLFDGPIQDAKEIMAWSREALPSLLPRVDGTRLVVFGHSAGGYLASYVGTQPNPPLAIFDCYGNKFLGSEWYRRPVTAFGLPDVDQKHLDKVFEGPTILSHPMGAFIKNPLLAAKEDPRMAWLLTQLFHGTSMAAVVQDEDYDRLKVPYGKGFPPTFFVHGTKDPLIDYHLTLQAYDTLKTAGVPVGIRIGDDADHMFDFMLSEEDAAFKSYIAPALDFLIVHSKQHAQGN